MSNELDALGYLQAVYQGKIIAEQTRMKAAIAVLPFEVPKLGVSVNLTGFATRMERAIEARGDALVIGASARSSHPRNSANK